MFIEAMHYLAAMVCVLRALLTWLLVLSSPSWASRSAVAELNSALQELMSNPSAAEVIKDASQVLEIVNDPQSSTVYVRYQVNKQDCLGRWVRLIEAPAGEFLADPKCQVSSELQILRSTSLVTSQLKLFSEALRFSQHFLSISPAMSQVIGVRQDSNNIVITYRSADPRRSLCRFSLRPPAPNSQLPMWRLVAGAACDEM